jgi:hypothetical protein
MYEEGWSKMRDYSLDNDRRLKIGDQPTLIEISNNLPDKGDSWVYAGVASEYSQFENKIVGTRNDIITDVMNERETIEKYLPSDPNDRTCKTAFFVFPSNQEETTSHDLFKQDDRYMILDAKQMKMKKTIKKESVYSILSQARNQLVFAMKHGKTLVVRLSDSLTDFIGTFNDDCCPVDVTSSDSVRLKGYKTITADRTTINTVGRSQLPIEFLLLSGWYLREVNSLFPGKLFRMDDLRDIKLYNLPNKAVEEEEDSYPESAYLHAGAHSIVSPTLRRMYDELETKPLTTAATVTIGVDNGARRDKEGIRANTLGFKNREWKGAEKRLASAVDLCHRDFRVIITTSMPLGRLDEYLFNGKYGLPPRENFRIIALA